LADTKEAYTFAVELITDKGKMNYDKVKSEAERYLTAEHAGYSVNRGRAAGGRANVEASLVVRGVKEARSGGRGMAQPTLQEELKGWAQKTGMWFDSRRLESEIISKAELMNAGSEANVYFINDIVYKVYNTNDAVRFLDNRISAYNAIFIESQYELVGLTENNDRELQFIVKQRRINGITLEALVKKASSTLSGKELTDVINGYKKAISERLSQYGFKEIPYGYSNGIVELTDVGMNNVMIEGDDIDITNKQLYFIDVQPEVKNEDY